MRGRSQRRCAGSEFFQQLNNCFAVSGCASSRRHVRLLSRMQAGGGLLGFSVICDDSNNSQEVVDAKSFVADISVKIPGSINYINISLTNT